MIVDVYKRQGYMIPHMPMQVHEVLIYHKVIVDPGITGSGKESTWISEKDWVYAAQVFCNEPIADNETWKSVSYTHLTSLFFLNTLSS